MEPISGAKLEPGDIVEIHSYDNHYDEAQGYRLMTLTGKSTGDVWTTQGKRIGREYIIIQEADHESS